MHIIWDTILTTIFCWWLKVRVLREHLKKSMSNSHKCQKQLSEYRQEVLRLGDQKKRLQEVATRKDLLGRDKLTKQLQLTTGLLKEKETKIAVSMLGG